jgi:hypothetical protein
MAKFYIMTFSIMTPNITILLVTMKSGSLLKNKCYADCRNLSIMLNVVSLNVVAPFFHFSIRLSCSLRRNSTIKPIRFIDTKHCRCKNFFLLNGFKAEGSRQGGKRYKLFFLRRVLEPRVAQW